MTVSGAQVALADYDDDNDEDDDEMVADPDADIPEGEETSSFSVELSSINEVDTPEGEEPDDPTFGQGPDGATGTAELRLDSDEGVICADLTTDGIPADDSFEDAPGAHLHQGSFEENGPIAVFFETPDDETGASSGCFTDFEDDFDPQETLGMVEDNPENWYVNIHTQDFEMGAVRGQLPAGGQDLIAPDEVEAGAGGSAPSDSGVWPLVLLGSGAVAAAGGATLVVRRRTQRADVV